MDEEVFRIIYVLVGAGTNGVDYLEHASVNGLGSGAVHNIHEARGLEGWRVVCIVCRRTVGSIVSSMSLIEPVESL